MENNRNRDYNRLQPGWSLNSAYNSGYNFIDISIGTFNTQCMAIVLPLNISYSLLSHFEAILEATLNQKRPW